MKWKPHNFQVLWWRGVAHNNIFFSAWRINDYRGSPWFAACMLHTAVHNLKAVTAHSVSISSYCLSAVGSSIVKYGFTHGGIRGETIYNRPLINPLTCYMTKHPLNLTVLKYLDEYYGCQSSIHFESITNDLFSCFRFIWISAMTIAFLILSVPFLLI